MWGWWRLSLSFKLGLSSSPVTWLCSPVSCLNVYPLHCFFVSYRVRVILFSSSSRFSSLFRLTCLCPERRRCVRERMPRAQAGIPQQQFIGFGMAAMTICLDEIRLSYCKYSRKICDESARHLADAGKIQTRSWLGPAEGKLGCSVRRML